MNVTADLIARHQSTTLHVREGGALSVPLTGTSGDLTVTKGGGFDPRWLTVLRDGLRQIPLRIDAERQGKLVGTLPLALVQSRLFGRFLVSLPYLNSAGVLAADDDVACKLIDRAVELADEYDVRYLELRQEREIAHPALTFQRTDKVHMRLPLPDSSADVLGGLKSKVRNQVKKAGSYDLEVGWGREELLDDFYAVFSRNMRDLGTPVFGRALFASIMEQFADEAEFCVVRKDARPIAAALLIHGEDATQVPSASSLREFNKTNANMLMYRHLLERAAARGRPVFDFGRSSEGSGTFRFKEQWRARPHPAVWQYYLRKGTADDMRPESAKNRALIRVWRRLPVWLTRCLGPPIVRGIP